MTRAAAVTETTAAPINAANVNILLSTDGGNSFPIVLAANTPNDGTQEITVPNLNSLTARLKVEAVNNIFFDISNAAMTIDGSSNLQPTVSNIVNRLLDPNTSTGSIPFTIGDERRGPGNRHPWRGPC